MGAIFGGGGGGGSAPAPQPAPVVAAEPSGASAADKERQRRIGRAALIASDQSNVLGPSTGRNVLTAV